jgi:AcrR family transcriptional regulator
MPSILRKFVRSTKRRVREWRRDGRTFALYDSASVLLAQFDCDDRRVSVARIAKGAGVSVGAFYARFESKDALIYYLTSNRFRAARDAGKQELAAMR